MTLLEVLVTCSVGAIVLMVLAGVLGQTGTVYADSNRAVEMLRDGRAGLGILRRDMAGMIRPVATADIKLSYVRDDAKMETACGMFTLQALGAQSRASASGDLCYVLYYLAVTDDPYSGVSRKLYRKLVSSADLAALLAKPIFVPPLPTPESDDVVAFNVLDFTMDFKFRAPTTGRWSLATTHAEVQAAEECEVTLRVLSGVASKALEKHDDWLPNGGEHEGFDFDKDENDDPAVRTFRALFSLNL